MGTRININGVGTVDVGDNFTSLTPEQQQHTVEEIAASAKSQGAAPAPQASAAPPAMGSPSGPSTYKPLELALNQQFPGLKFTSDARTPDHNRAVGGVPNSMHVSGDAVDMVGGAADTHEGRQQIRDWLSSQGIQPREFLYHNVGSGNHLHIGVDKLPDAFRTQFGGPGAAPVAPGAQLSSDDFKAQFKARLLKGATDDELKAFANDNNRDIVQASLDKFRKAQGTNPQAPVAIDDKLPGEAPAPDAYNGPKGTQHDLDYYGDQIRRGVGDLIDAPANIANMVYQGGHAIGRMATGGPVMGDNGELPLPAIARPGQMLNEAQDQAEAKDIGDVPEAANAPQRYAGAVTRMVAGSAIPAAKLAGLGKARAALALLSGAASGGVGGEAGADIAPTLGVDPNKARLVGQVLGSVAGSAPLAVKPLAEARFVNKQVKNNPYAPYDAEIAQELKGLTTNKARAPTDPKGRSAVTATEINDLERSYTTAYQKKINALNIDDVSKRELTDALLEDHSIGTDKLDALRGTPEGDAVATGIIKAQRLRALTPEVKRAGGMVTIRRVSEILGTTVGAMTGGPVGAPAGLGLVRLAMRRGTEAEAARVHSAARVIARAPLYERVAAKVGPSGQIAAKDALNQAYDDTKASAQAATDAASAARQDKVDQAAAAAKAKDDLKASRHGMTDKEFANYTARSASASDALSAEPVAKPQSKSAQAALNKYNKVAATGAAKLSSFDEALNAAPKEAPPVKMTAENTAIANTMQQGLNGYHRAYAETISSHLGVDVKPEEVLKVVKDGQASGKLNLSDVDQFELQKFQMQHKISPAARAAILPRVEALLKEDPAIKARIAKAQEPAPPPAPKAPAVKAKAPAVPKAPPMAQAIAEAPAPAPEAAPAPEPAPTSGDYRRVVRKDLHAGGKARNQAAFDAERDRLTADDSHHSMDIVEAASHGLDHIRNGEKTTESAMRYFDEDLGPELRRKDFHPQEIEDLRKDVERMAKVGKTYRTDAEFDRGAKLGARGRPHSRPSSSEDVPF